MIEPPPSRVRKKPSATLQNSANSPRKLKLVCSFNGAFRPRPPSGKLRYVGGETRIISIDRNISFSKLQAKMADLCPKINSFSLKYQLPVSVNVKAGDAELETTLVVIASDEDVRCMVEEYEKLDMYGKNVRLWVFVCANMECYGNNGIDGGNSVKGNSHFCVNWVDSYGSNEVCYNELESQNFEAQGFRAQSDCNNKVANNVVNGVNGVSYVDYSLRKMVLKQRLLFKQSAKRNDNQAVPDLGVINGGAQSACCVMDKSDDHPLIDLRPEPELSVIKEDQFQVNFLNHGIPNAYTQRRENYGNLVQTPRSQNEPSSPRNGKLHLKNNDLMQFLTRQLDASVCNGVDANAGISCGSVAVLQASEQPFNRGMISKPNGFDAKNDFRIYEQHPQGNLNRENIMPWTTNCNSLSTNLASLPHYNQWGSCQNVFRNHRLGVNQRIYPYYVRNHRNNQAEVGNGRVIRLEGWPLSGKCCPGQRQSLKVSKQGCFMRLCDPNLHNRSPGLSWQAMEGSVRKEESGLTKVDCFFGHSNPEESHLAYHGACTAIGSQPPNITESPSSCVTASKEDLLRGSNYEKPDPLFQTPYENSDASSLSCAPQNRKSVAVPQKVSKISDFSNDMCYNDEVEYVCKTKLLGSEVGNNSCSKNEDGTHKLQGGVAHSVDLLSNLSLSPSKEVHPSTLCSQATSNISDALLNPQSKASDFIEEVHISEGLQVNEVNELVSDSSLPNLDKLGKSCGQGEEIQYELLSDFSIDKEAEATEITHCSKVIAGISSDLFAFYTHLATRELQTIKYSDLEYIKELGSGTYGTVFYGKWKGSDVAIKRIKPSCFFEKSMEEEKLVADFWREAHILGQLHHPNIVALYGVVTDGPVTNLATVAEYMVNGSLKQVLRRKDRTIDRRKRLIIAMDAAFGMEYLHEKNVVHFDLKSHNFLVNMRDPQRPVCKIGDLGLSKIKQRTLVSGGVRGTIPWMAPELLNSKNNMVTEKVDVYSFGIVMWELLTGEEPYANLRSEEIIAGIIKGILRPEIPSWCDPAWRSMMERCWSSDPDSRPAFSEITKELRAMSAAMNIK